MREKMARLKDDVDKKSGLEKRPTLSLFVTPITKYSSHYHFIRKKDMKEAMRYNWNPYDTFSWGREFSLNHEQLRFIHNF